MLNPLTGIIKAFRSSVLGQALDWQSLAASAPVTFAAARLLGPRFPADGEAIRRHRLVRHETIIKAENVSKRYTLGRREKDLIYHYSA